MSAKKTTQTKDQNMTNQTPPRTAPGQFTRRRNSNSQYRIYHRTWWTRDGRPGPGPKTTIGYATDEETARKAARLFNGLHPNTGRQDRRAEYREI